MRHGLNMRARVIVAGLATIAAALPFATAGAGHCDSKILLLTGRGLVFHHGATGCAIGEEDLNTDIVQPGGGEMLVRYSSAAKPLGTSTLTFPVTQGPLRGCVDSGSTKVCTINWTQATDNLGNPIAVWESEFYSYGATTSVGSQPAVVSVCIDAADTFCESRTYHTPGSLL